MLHYLIASLSLQSLVGEQQLFHQLIKENLNHCQIHPQGQNTHPLYNIEILAFQQSIESCN